jgi:hypothetical protein
MREYNDRGYGSGYKDFFTDSWGSGLTKGSKDISGALGDAGSDVVGGVGDLVSSVGKVFQGGGSMPAPGGPVNPLNWLNMLKKVEDLF